MRDRLIELLTDNLPMCGNSPLGYNPLQLSCNETVEMLADHLIANGVVVQEWISVKDRLPEKDKEVLCLLGNGECWVAVWDHCDDGLWTDGEWWRAKNFVTHWMPLPPAPKGE